MSGELKGKRCISAEGSNVKSSAMGSYTSGLKVKEEALYFPEGAPLIIRGL